ncbi:MAG: HEAT repeat domain-containing protein, partial [Deltaproteobacteria bacterium]|nr:HEAT repeat domain-containing protein [Deltaproteobacteria bacterium]
ASRDRHLAESAVRALGEVGTAGAQKALSGYVTMDGNQRVSMMSAFVLRDSGDLVAAYDLLPVLQAAADDRDVMLAASVIGGINRREKDPSLAQALAEAVLVLEEVINDDSRGMWDKVGAARTLGTIGSDEASRVLLDVAGDVENPNGHVQRTAIQMLGASGSADVAGELERILAYSTEIDHQVRIATAIGEVASRHPDSYAVGIAESVAIPLIHSIAISAETTDLQRHAVEALGEIGTPTDITVLRQAGIANRDLATAVEEAISDIEDRAQGIDTGRDSLRWWRPF